MSGRERLPIAERLLSWSLLLLLACWALNEAAQLLLAVWPVLVGACGLVLTGVLGWRFLVRRRSGW